MKNQNYTSRISFLSLIIMIILLATAATALAQEGAKVYLQPLDSEAGSLSVDVMAENVSNMYGAEFKLSYNPAELAVQDSQLDREGLQIEAGSLLPSNKGFVVANTVDEVAGTITFALTLLNPAPAVDGTGPLARINFKLLGTTPSTIGIERVKLVAADLQTIPSSTESLVVSAQTETIAPEVVAAQPSAPEANQVETTTAAPVNNPSMAPAADEATFPWWIVAAAILILGVLGLVAFITMSGFSNPKKNKPVPVAPKLKQQLQSTPQEPIQVQIKQPTPKTRPSAFE